MKPINYTLRIGAIVALILLLSSCSVLKKTHKTDTSTAIKAESEVSKNTETKSETDSKTKSQTTIEADTTAQIPGKTESGSTPITGGTGAIFLSDSTVIRFSGGGWKTVGDNGTLVWTVTTPPKQVPVKFKKTITTEEEKKVTSTVKIDSTGKAKVKQDVHTSDKTKDVHRSGFPWWLWIVLALAFVGLAAWYLRKRGII